MLSRTLRKGDTLRDTVRTLIPDSRPAGQYVCSACLSRGPSNCVALGLKPRRSKHYETKRRAPSSTRKESFLKETTPLHGFGIEEHLRWKWPRTARGSMGFKASKEELGNACKFVERYMGRLRTKAPGSHLTSSEFKDLLHTHGLEKNPSDPDDRRIWWLSWHMRRFSDKQVRADGQKLLFNMALLDDFDSVMYSLHLYLKLLQEDPKTRQMPVASRIRQVLQRRFVETYRMGHKLHYTAVVMEAKLCAAEGKQDHAIELLESVVDDAIEASTIRDQRKSEQGRVEKKYQEEGDQEDPAESFLFRDETYDLTRPWITLLEIYLQRFHDKNDARPLETLNQAVKYIQIGCAQDDPRAHLLAADYYKNPRHGEESAKWLYHITKAAASGYPQAACELAEYYLVSGWRYIEDDPPLHVRPTAFDKYPMMKETPAVPAWLAWLPDWLKPFVRNPASSQQPWDNLYLLDAHPQTARERMHMAYDWLAGPLRVNYLPASITLARICLTETLWSQADAPESARRLSKERYEYESEPAWKARHAMDGNENAATRTAKEQSMHEENVPKEMPNPYYNVGDATALLNHVYDAYEGLLTFERAVARIDHVRKTGQGYQENYFTPEHLREHVLGLDHPRGVPGLPWAQARWFDFPQILYLFSRDFPSMFRTVHAICDEHGLVLHDQDGRIRYDGRGKTKAETSRTRESAAM